MSLDDGLIWEAFNVSRIAQENGYDFKKAFVKYVYHAKLIDDLVKRRDYFLDVVDYYRGGFVDGEVNGE